MQWHQPAPPAPPHAATRRTSQGLRRHPSLLLHGHKQQGGSGAARQWAAGDGGERRHCGLGEGGLHGGRELRQLAQSTELRRGAGGWPGEEQDWCPCLLPACAETHIRPLLLCWDLVLHASKPPSLCSFPAQLFAFLCVCGPIAAAAMSAPVQSLFVTLKRSFAGTRESHIRVLRSLGFTYRQQTLEKPNVAHIRGAIDKARGPAWVQEGGGAAAAGEQRQAATPATPLASLTPACLPCITTGASHGAGRDGRAACDAASSRGGGAGAAAASHRATLMPARSSSPSPAAPLLLPPLRSPSLPLLLPALLPAPLLCTAYKFSFGQSQSCCCVAQYAIAVSHAPERRGEGQRKGTGCGGRPSRSEGQAVARVALHPSTQTRGTWPAPSASPPAQHR